jgi:disulfide bond formation protein DsbB
MEGYVATINYLLAAGTVLLGLLVCITLLTRVTTGVWFPPSVDAYVRKVVLYIIAAWGVFAVIMSFWYSDVVGFTPCPLCWLARTMMFPLAVVGIVAAWRNDRNAWPYMVALSSVGMLITGYHHLYQMGIVSGTACKALEGAGDCAQRFVFEFGFVTLPLMGFVMFSAIALLAWIGRTK